MSENIAISVKNVKKDFVLPHEKTTSIKSGIVNIFRKKDKASEIQHALRGISFDVKEGEFFGILGRNGSGKSTLLKMLAEIYQPTSGKVTISGKLVPFIELGVGFNPDLTGRENVYLNGALLGFSKKEIDARYEDIVKFAELEDFMDQKLKNYSSGMQVRLAFSVATRAEADVLLIDEVLAVGDADFQRKCYNYFKSLKKSGKTVVFVTHDMGAVQEYCDKAILINEGKITHEGKAADVADEYLKLFNEPTREEDKKVNTENRWGDGKVRMSNIKASVSGDEVEVSLTLTGGDEPLDDVIVDVKVVDDKNNLLAGFGSHNTTGGAATGISIDAHGKAEVKFTATSVMSGGKYSLNISVLSTDGITIYDHISRAASITIKKPKTYYPVKFNGKVDISK